MRLPHRRDRRDALPAREQDRIVGISGYVVRAPQARREKPRVSAFTSANIDKILALKPDGRRFNRKSVRQIEPPGVEHIEHFEQIDRIGGPAARLPVRG